MNILILALLALFCIKILWNLSIPYALAFRRTGENGETAGISLAPFVEFPLLFLCWGSAFFASNDFPAFLHPKSVALYGFLLILGSYVHLMVMAFLLGWVRSLFEKSKI